MSQIIETTGVKALLAQLRVFPWADTAATLRERFREDRLGLTASSLTFTTTVSLVPLIALALAVFTAFPVFGKLQDGLQRWLVDSLMPESIARQVLSYVTQFASKASRLGLAGLVVLVGSGLALMLTIDKTLNQIWRVRKPRPFAQRVLVYWGAITLGPLVLALSVGATTWALAGASGAGPVRGLVRVVADLLQFLSLAAGMCALYHYIPNTVVRWGHAWAGGVFVALAFELAQRSLGFYLKAVPTYSVIYGAFATVPILLIWIYLSWVIVLLGAVVAAYLPALTAGAKRRQRSPGWALTLACEIMRELQAERQAGQRGLNAQMLGQRLHIDPLQLQHALATLHGLGWVAELGGDDSGTMVMLVDPASTDAMPLFQALLMSSPVMSMAVFRATRLDALLATPTSA